MARWIKKCDEEQQQFNLSEDQRKKFIVIRDLKSCGTNSAIVGLVKSNFPTPRTLYFSSSSKDDFLAYVKARKALHPFNRVELCTSLQFPEAPKCLEEIESNPDVTEFCLRCDGVVSNVLKQALQIVGTKSTLTHFEIIITQQPPSDDYELLGDVLANHTSLKEFKLRHSYPQWSAADSELIDIIMKGLMANKSIEQLSLTDFYWNSDSLKQKSIMDIVADRLVQLLERKPSQYKRLTFMMGHAATKATCKSWGNVLQTNVSLTHLSICNIYSPVSDQLCKYLCRGLSVNRTLRSLKLIDDKISATGIKYIALLIEKNTALQQLIFDVQNIQLDLTPIYNALFRSQSIQRVTLPFNNGISAKRWLDLLRTNRLLSLLQFFSSTMTSRELKQIQEECQYNKRIQIRDVAVIIHNIKRNSSLWTSLPQEIWHFIFEWIGCHTLFKRVINSYKNQ